MLLSPLLCFGDAHHLNFGPKPSARVCPPHQYRQGGKCPCHLLDMVYAVTPLFRTTLQNHPSLSHQPVGWKLLKSCSMPPPSVIAAATQPLSHPSCCCCRGAVVASPERTTGRCQPCGKRKVGQGRSGLLLSLPPLSCMLPFELTPIQVCTCTRLLYNLCKICLSVIGKHDATFVCCL